MLEKDNKGLEYVKHLILIDNVKSSTPNQPEDYPEVGLLFHLLARDTLKTFRWRSCNPLPHQFYQILYSRQRSLQRVELNCSDISIDEMFEPPSSPLCSLHKLTELNALRIMPQMDEAMPKIGCELFNKHDTIRRLELDLVHMHVDTDGDKIKEALTSGGAMNAFFGGLTSSSAQLTTLDLRGVNLSVCHEKLLSALDLPKLSSLTVIKCQYPEHFLAALAESPSVGSIQLEEFVLYHSRNYESPDDDEAVESDPLLAAAELLLTKLSPSLQELWICLRGFDRLPDVKSLVHHGSTIRWLFMDVRERKGPNGIRNYNLMDWRMLCKSLKDIQQLDMIYPKVVTPYMTAAYPEFCDYVRETASINTLARLGVNNWPFIFSRSSRESFTISRDAGRCALSTLATDIMNLRRESEIRAFPTVSFETPQLVPKDDSSPTKLQVITFGLCEEITNSSIWGYGLDPPMDFLKSCVSTVGGQQSWTMSTVTRCANSLDCDLLGQEYDIDQMAHDSGKFEQNVEW
ncbi:MAG: hypothetical protein Q9169_007685 [Polycauliona sp. 2 TL-2023]